MSMPPSTAPVAPPAPAAPPPKKRGPWPWIAGGCGCVVVLCAFLGAGLLFANSQGLFSAPTPTATATVPPTPTTAAATPTSAGPLPRLTPAGTTAAPRTTPAPGGRATPGINLTIPPIRLPTIGGATPSAGARGFDVIKFAVGVLDDEKPIDVLDAFPQGTTAVYAIWNYANMQDGQSWRREWLLNGKVQTDLLKEQQWSGGTSGAWWVSIFNKDGVSVGDWTLNLYLDNRLVQSGKFRVDAAAAGQPNFTPIVFAENRDAKDNPVDPLPPDSAVLDSSVTQVHAFFNGVGMTKGTKFTTQWFYNGTADTDEKTYTWDSGPTDSYWVRYFRTDGTELPAGVYEFKLKIGTRLVKIASVTVQ